MTSKSRKQQIEEMLAEDPNDSFLRYGLAMEYAGLKQYDEAARCLRELIGLDPGYVPAYFQAGKALAELNRLDEARAVLRSGIAVAMQKGDGHAAGEMEVLLDDIR
jgi:tetratricopeptide (TPR) repeat protein